MGRPFQLLLTIRCDLHEHIRRGDEGDLNSFSRKELLNVSAMGGGGSNLLHHTWILLITIYFSLKIYIFSIRLLTLRGKTVFSGKTI